MIDPETMSREEFVELATSKLGQVAQTPSAVKLYIEGDEAQVSELEKGDVVYVALTGSPYREGKLTGWTGQSQSQSQSQGLSQSQSQSQSQRHGQGRSQGRTRGQSQGQCQSLGWRQKFPSEMSSWMQIHVCDFAL